MYNSIEEYTYTPICTILEKRSFVMKPFRERLMEPLEHLLELGGIRKDITLRVLPGETVPVDGIITAGQTTIKLNLTFSMTLNFIAITLAVTGILNPVVGALVHNAGSVLVIINSALLLNRKRS